MKHIAAGFVLGLVAIGAASSASAQPPPPPLDQERGISPAEVQRMFDAYALVQAQDQLKLPDDQFPQFLSRFKALQETRRRTQMERGRLIQELVRLSRLDNPDEAQMRSRLKDLKDLETRSAGEIRTAYDAVDQVLDVRQQAQFRVFEEQMERRKIELVVRARQNNRLRNRPEPK
jgi:Spy/CpxP family protein refolding chaperone